MWTDPIVDEVRKAREAYAKKLGYDLDRIFADLKKSEKKRLATAKRAKGKKAEVSKPAGRKRRAA